MKPEQRLHAMMEAIGLDPDTVKDTDMPVIAKELHERCASCRSDEACDEWLQGVKTGDNSFCPNSPMFEILKRYGGHASS